MPRLMLALTILVVLLSVTLSGCVSWTAERKYPPIGEFAEVSGERLHYIDIGPRDSAKHPVVLIHGASVNLRDMKMALGDRLADERRVIIVDRPGRGYSTRPANGWRLSEQARLVHELVNELGAEQPIILGQSFGGSVALAYAVDYEETISGLMTLAPVSHEWPGSVVWYNRLSGVPIAGQVLRRLVMPVYASLTAKDAVDQSFNPDPAPANYYDRAGVPLLFRAGDFRNNASDIRHLKPQVKTMSARYSGLELPVSVITGADDTTVSPDLHARALAAALPNATLDVLPDTGHALHHAETEVILEAVAALDERIAAGAGAN